MDVKIIEMPAVPVAYLRYKGPYGAAIGDFWMEVFAPWQQAAGLQGRTTYGVAVDDPATTPPEECRYDACVEVEPGYQPQAPARLAELPSRAPARRSRPPGTSSSASGCRPAACRWTPAPASSAIRPTTRWTRTPACSSASCAFR